MVGDGLRGVFLSFNSHSWGSQLVSRWLGTKYLKRVL